MVLTMGDPDSNIMNYVVRMVIPMKREFGRALDVTQFMNDRPYAIEVIQQALQSKDGRLREYATYVQGKLFGPRTSDLPALAARNAAPAPASQKAEPAPTGTSPIDEAELRARMLAKYKSGLR